MVAGSGAALLLVEVVLVLVRTPSYPWISSESKCCGRESFMKGGGRKRRGDGKEDPAREKLNVRR